VISRDKTYKLRNGWQYKLYNILSDEERGNSTHIVHGAFLNPEDKTWTACEHNANGFYYDDDCESECDLIESTPFGHIKIDDKVIVWKDGIDNSAFHRHFAGVNEQGKPKTWRDGKTSFTTPSTIEWDHCELFIE
jgi:hypothetical protein